MIPFDALNWYWIIGDDETQVYSSARAVMVPVTDESYRAWLSFGATPSRVAAMDDLAAALRAANVPPYATVLVPKSVIVDRLHGAGKLEAARAALDQADLYTRERWNNRDSVYADDPTTVAVLTAIGADPAAILAP